MLSGRRRLKRERDEARQERDDVKAERDAAEADAAELRRKYEPPVTVRRVVSGGAVESKRRRH